MAETPLVTPVDPHTLDSKSPLAKSSPQSKQTLVFVLVIIVGLAVGFFLSRSQSTTSNNSVISGDDIIKTDTEVGSKDTVTFRDSATGTMEAGGLNGEGTHKLIRDGGPSQTVYLISSIVDLGEFVGKKVEVWGETIKAQRVGWLMDVGRVKIVE